MINYTVNDTVKIDKKNYTVTENLECSCKQESSPANCFKRKI